MTRYLSQKSVCASMSLSRDSHLLGCSLHSGASRSPHKIPGGESPRRDLRGQESAWVSSSSWNQHSTTSALQKILQMSPACSWQPKHPDFRGRKIPVPEQTRHHLTEDLAPASAHYFLHFWRSVCLTSISVVLIWCWDYGIGPVRLPVPSPGQRGLRCCKPNPATLHF